MAPRAAVLTALGLQLFLDHVSVTSTLSSTWGGHAGLLLLPPGLALALLFVSYILGAWSFLRIRRSTRSRSSS